MNDVILGILKKYTLANKKLVFALRDWITRNMKDFSLLNALECIYLYTGGHFDKMSDIITQLTAKKKVYGRTQVYNTRNDAGINIIRDGKGKLQLVGYNPNWKPDAKGQHVTRNPKIFRKTDDQISKTYQNSERKMMDFGQQVRDLYPTESNMYLTHAMQAIKRYAISHKISPERVINRIKRGTLILHDEEFNSFEVTPPISSENHVIVISQRVNEELNKDFEMTEFKFNNNIRNFLADLLNDPANAKPSLLLRRYGLNRSKLIGMMNRIGMIDRSERISDTDENGQPKTATMMVKYRVPKKNFERKLKKLYMRIFEKNLPPRHSDTDLNEDGEGGGATSADSSGQFSQPMFGIQRRKMPTDVEEATTTFNDGDYEYDVPFSADKETLARKNGVGGSVSINYK